VLGRSRLSGSDEVPLSYLAILEAHTFSAGSATLCSQLHLRSLLVISSWRRVGGPD
jgi:hypothetical protein